MIVTNKNGRFSKQQRGFGAAASLLAFLAAGVPAHAQDMTTSVPEDERDQGEIVVTASKRGAVSIQNAPLNISAIDSEQLRKTSAVTIDDVVRQIPGIAVTGGQSNKTIIIRGLAATAGAPQVGVYLDETPLSGIGGTNVRQSDIGLYDVERVEVLRGPQGTLYGAGSQAGTVRYITNKPDTVDYAGLVGAKVGFRARDGGQRFEGNAMLNIPLATDQLAVRAVGYGRRVDGFVKVPALGREQSDVEKTYGGRVEILAKPGPDTSILFSAIYQNTKLDDVNRVSVGADSRPNPVREPYQDKLQLLNLTVEQGVGFGTITATGSTYQRNTFFAFDQSQYVRPRSGSINQTSQTDGTTGELRFSSDLKGPFQFIGGVFYERRDLEAVSAGLFVDPANGLPYTPDQPFFISPSEQYVVNKAAFINTTLDITSRLSVEAGIRFYDMKRRNESALTLDLFGRPIRRAPTQRASSNGNVKKLRLSYQATTDVLVYATYSEGFREGGPNAVGLLGTYPLTFDPDFVKNYELGWKTSAFDRQLKLNGALYYMSWDDIQVSQRDPTGAFAYTSNAGKANLKGIELEGRFNPRGTSGFAVNFAVRYSDQKLTQDNPLIVGPPANPNAGRDGERIPYTSRFSGNLGLEQGFKLGDDEGFARIDASYVGKSFTSFSRTDPTRREMGDYPLVDARTGIRKSVWDVALYVKNIFNKRGVTEWSIETVPGLADRVRTTDPREAGVELTVRF